jgi:rhodanese-related sulfurtransferase
MSHPTSATIVRNLRTGVHLVGLDELKTKLDHSDSFLLVMAMDQRRFDTAHIEGSVSFDTLLEELPNLGRETEIVMYCTNEACVASKLRSTFLIDSGFTRVSRFAGGLAEWSQAGLPLAERS